MSRPVDVIISGVQTPEATTAWQCGYVSVSDVRHAVRPTLAGPQAWCGGGRIGRMHIDRFATSDTAACALCAETVAALIPSQRCADELVATGT